MTTFTGKTTTFTSITITCTQDPKIERAKHALAKKFYVSPQISKQNFYPTDH